MQKPGFLVGSGYKTARGGRQGPHGPPDPGERSDPFSWKLAVLLYIVEKDSKFQQKRAVAERLALKAADREIPGSIPARALPFFFSCVGCSCGGFSCMGAHVTGARAMGASVTGDRVPVLV